MASKSSALTLLLATTFAAVAVPSAHGIGRIDDRHPIILHAGEQKEVHFRVGNCSGNNLTIEVATSDSRVLVCETCSFGVKCNSNSSMRLRGVAIGLVEIQLSADGENTVLSHGAAVTRPPATIVDNVFIYCLVVISGFGMVCFGASLDMKLVHERLKKPKSLLVGLGCQFTLMPTTAFAIAWMTPLPAPLALGVFTAGCVPAGGASNSWTRLLGGDVDLSVVLTFVGTIAAFGTMPLWIYTLGRLIYEGSAITVPYLDMLQTVALTTVPLVIGILMTRFVPKFGRVLSKAVYPMSIILIVYLLTFGIYANVFIFEVIGREPQVLTAALLPCVGMLMAGLIALACRESKTACVAIAVEACIQNLGTAFVLLRLSLEPPWSDIALCAPALVNLAAVPPLMLTLAGQMIYKKLSAHVKASNNSIGGRNSAVKAAQLNSSLSSHADDGGGQVESRRRPDVHTMNSFIAI